MPVKYKKRADYVEEAARAHSNLNLWGAVVTLLEGGRIKGGCSLHDAEKPELCQKALQSCPEPRTVDCCGVVDEHDIVECHRIGRQWTVPCNFDEDYA